MRDFTLSSSVLNTHWKIFAILLHIVLSYDWKAFCEYLRPNGTHRRQFDHNII